MADLGTQRRRVGLRTTFHAAVETAKQSPGGGMFEDLMAAGVWTLGWWVRGVPVEVLEREDIL
jgi:hypothetical protein